MLLVTGEGGRGVIEEWLRKEGIPVEVYYVYRRVAAAVQVKTVQIDAIEAASGDGVRRAAQVWFAAGGESQVPVLVPTARVGAIAAECGFREIVICAGASPVDVLRGLRQAMMDKQ